MRRVDTETLTSVDLEWLKSRTLNWLVEPHLISISGTFHNGIWKCEMVLVSANTHREFKGMAKSMNRVEAMRKAYEEASRKLNVYLDDCAAKGLQRIGKD